MSWIVIDSLVCPQTGTVFSWLSTCRRMKMVILYKGCLYLKPGDEISTAVDGIIVNGHHTAITLYYTAPYNSEVWNLIRDISACPGNKLVKVPLQPCPDKCNINICPYGLVTK